MDGSTTLCGSFNLENDRPLDKLWPAPKRCIPEGGMTWEKAYGVSPRSRMPAQAASPAKMCSGISRQSGIPGFAASAAFATINLVSFNELCTSRRGVMSHLQNRFRPTTESILIAPGEK